MSVNIEKQKRSIWVVNKKILVISLRVELLLHACHSLKDERQEGVHAH
jgi:hypothetical protein